jgi:hypothetical protein
MPLRTHRFGKEFIAIRSVRMSEGDTCLGCNICEFRDRNFGRLRGSEPFPERHAVKNIREQRYVLFRIL